MDTGETRLIGPALIVLEIAGIRMHDLASTLCFVGPEAFVLSLLIMHMTTSLQQQSC